MFFHLGSPGFVSVINTGHLVASSELHCTWTLKCEEEKLPGFSFSSSCVSMINVTYHLLTPRGQAFAPSPIILLLPAVFWLPLNPMDSLYLLGQHFFSPALLDRHTDTRQLDVSLFLFSVKCEMFSSSRFIFPELSIIHPVASEIRL